jgi:hypothetical protein
MSADQPDFTWRKSSYSGNESQCVEIGFTWQKSSYSGNNVNCVEIGHGREAVGIRDTKDPAGGTLLLTTAAFHALLRTTRA